MSSILKGIINEVNPNNYDSDWDYQDALNRKPQRRSEPSGDEPEDHMADYYRKQDAAQAKYRKEVNIEHVNKEGVAPNGERYNSAFIVRANDPYKGDNEIYKFNDVNWGAKKIVDTVKKNPDEAGEPYITIVYYVDNHKHGYWTPWKGEAPVSKGVQFNEELMSEGISQEDLADILLHRLELRYPDVVSRYEQDLVRDCVLDVAGFHEGAEELGTSDVSIMLRQVIRRLEDSDPAEQVNELSPDTLASYKKKAGADATQADKRADYARGDKRMSGIIKATKKEFDNDAKGVTEGPDFDKWADDRAASQLYKLKPATEWTVSYDYGPHMTKSVTVKARSEQEARDKVEKAAEKKGMSIMINSVEQDVSEEKQRLDPSCWKGYKKQGTKMKGDTRVNNCVPVKKESAIMKGLVDENSQGDK